MKKWIAEFKDGEHIYEQLMVVNVNKCVSNTGQQYLNIKFQDRTGTIEGKKWEVLPGDLDVIIPGAIVQVDGQINLYKGVNQLKVVELVPLKPETAIDVINFQIPCPVSVDELKEKLNKFLNSFKDKDIELITKTVVSKYYDDFVVYPGAKSIHHDFGSGLLMHSITMAELADTVAKMYPNIDRDLLVAGAIMHDIGKTIEYSSPMAPQITVEGKLVGHISIMYAEFKRIVDELNIKSEVPLLLEHMILSHHGTREFGCPVVPQTKEALLLSMIDLLDSRMMVLDKALKDVKPGEFSEKIWSMDNVCFYKPKERK